MGTPTWAGAPLVLTLNDRGAQPPTATSPIPQYIARQQIVFDPTTPGFQSITGDNFTTLIDANATTTGAGNCNADPNAVDLFDDDGTNNKLFARDAHTLALNYYNDGTFTDFSPIGTTKPNALAPALPIGENHPLYNGNIGSMAVNIRKLAAQANAPGAAYAGPMLYNYRYDQLNRIVNMDAWQADGGYNAGSLAKMTAFAESYAYDPNGNILALNRNGANTTGNPLAMDQLAYSYKPNTNQLDHVNDQIAAGNYANDIDDQPANNYRYDAIGNMVYDNNGKIGNIDWTVYGKIGTIYDLSNNVKVSYAYDASGNRISKMANGVETWYVRDATGNVMATYTKGDATVNSGSLTQAEVDLYGSSRLGLLNTSVNCGGNNQGPAALGNAWDATYNRGQKLFELTNHLGNVLATVTDRLVPVPDASNTLIDHNLPDVASANDYYPLGMAMPGRGFSAGIQYRYGYNGKENDAETGYQDYGMRDYDPDRGQFISVDPLAGKFAYYSPYQYAGNNPVKFTDLDGGEPKGPVDDYVDYMDPVTHKIWGGNYTDSKLGVVNMRYVADKAKPDVGYTIAQRQGDPNFYYWTGDPNVISGGSFSRYETYNQKAVEWSGKLVDNLSAGFAGLIAAPFAIEAMGVTGGGSVLSASLPETVGIGVLKFAAGAGGDLWAQWTIDSKAPINWVEVGLSGGASTFGLNPWTGAFVSNVIQQGDDGNYISPLSDKWDGKKYVTSSIVQGAVGAIFGKALPELGPVKGAGVSNNAVSTGLNAILNYWGTTAGSASGNATQQATPADKPSNLVQPIL